MGRSRPPIAFEKNFAEAVNPTPELVHLVVVRSRRGGDREAIILFVTEGGYGRAIATVRAVCGTDCDPEDAVQEALAEALSRDDVRNLGPWVASVAVNNARQQRRRDTRRHELHGSLALPEPQSEPSINDDVIRALAVLPDRQREIVVLHYFWDISVAAVASVLGVSQGTVKVQLWRARARLGSELTRNKMELDA